MVNSGEPAVVTLAYSWGTLVRLTRLRRRRLERGLTLQALAELVGLSRKSLGYIERGEREPRPGNITKLADALDCRPVDLMEPEQT